ncbi:unnamed protein product [Spirodela intermedia]|uniref:Uncharacterized protein n=1 Tax=Spirodela intermedia TaxID=51605 RepID=A0A7I8KD07_SPIIN|nr:unnamed protein product [Spirodela intermedia]
MARRGEKLEEPLLHEEERGGSEADMGDITTCRTFLKEAVEENKRLWYLAGPAIFTSIAQYSLGAVTQVFAGHLTTLELDAVSTENMVIAGLAFGIMVRLLSPPPYPLFSLLPHHPPHRHHPHLPLPLVATIDRI